MADFQQSRLDTFFYWIITREAVRQRKESGLPKPWSDDPLFQKNRWCNVRRLDDRVSRWLFDHWYPAQKNSHYSEIAYAVLARLINWPDSLAELIAPAGFAAPRETLALRALRKEKVFTGAYIVPGVPGHGKVDSVFNTVSHVNGSSPQIDRSSMRETHRALMSFNGIGSFLAGQVVADLAHLHTGYDWADKHVWAPLGPGSTRGINRLLGRPKTSSLKQREFDGLLPELIEIVKQRIPEIWKDRKLEGFDIQNCLCEYDKAERLMNHEGQVRARYPGV